MASFDEIIKCQQTDVYNIGGDWYYPGEYPIESIQFVPGAANDELFVREGSETGAIIFHALAPKVLNGKLFIKYYHGEWHQPYIKFAECTLSAQDPHHVFIEKR